MKTSFFTILMLVVLSASLFPQSGSINNTLGTGGLFNIKDGSTTFLSLSQSTGYLNLNKSFTLPVTTGSTLGVIFKGADRFIHDYKASGTDGYNTFVGVNSGNFTMSASSGYSSYNTAVGHSSLTSLTTGLYNSAFGCRSLYSNTTGSYNSAFGYQSLYSNTAGYDNCAFGRGSLFSTTDGYQNSAFGLQSIYFNTTGKRNCAFGFGALLSNIAGNDNSAFGFESLYQSTGNNNTALGDSAGYNLTTGSNNTFIGFQAQPSYGGVSNQIVLGDANITSLRCNVTSISSLSDARDKKNIKDLSLGLDFLMSVKPRLFNWDRREWYEEGKTDGSKMQENPTAGFIAQELDEAQMKSQAEWLNLVLKSNPERLEATPGNLLPIMVKAIQELKAQNDALTQKLARFERTQQLLVSEIERMKSEDGKTLGQVRQSY